MHEPERLSPLLTLGNGTTVTFRSPGVVIEERAFVGKLAIRGRASEGAFRAGLQEIFGVLPPAPGRAVSAAGATILCLGPTEWLAVGGPAGFKGQDSVIIGLKKRLSSAGLCVVDVSSATTVLRISGSGRSRSLRKICALQLDRLPASSAARTRMGRLAILVHVVDSDRYDLFVPRSYAHSFFDQLRDAAELQP